nr:unnamed protein product [Digitaria exilis]
MRSTVSLNARCRSRSGSACASETMSLHMPTWETRCAALVLKWRCRPSADAASLSWMRFHAAVSSFRSFHTARHEASTESDVAPRTSSEEAARPARMQRSMRP